MGLQASYRATQAAQKRQQREAKKRERELERENKEQAKLTVLEQARLEVDTYENSLEVLLSIHKEEPKTWDWQSMAASLAPVCPQRRQYHELRTQQTLAVARVPRDRDTLIANARIHDDHEYQEALAGYTAEKSEWEGMSTLARRILAGDTDAYIQALESLNQFDELATVGSSFHFSVHGPRMLVCIAGIKEQGVIPTETKSLTAAGKVSVKTMPKGRFEEIYQDYLCGCVLRIAREILALLPVDTVIVTATADSVDPRTGTDIQRPVISVAIPRETAATLNYDRLDPSDALMQFTHRGEAKPSRPGNNDSIKPLEPEDLPRGFRQTITLQHVVEDARQLRADITATAERLRAPTEAKQTFNGEPA